MRLLRKYKEMEFGAQNVEKMRKNSISKMIPQFWSYVQIKSKVLSAQIARAFDLQLWNFHISIRDCSPDTAPPVADAENRHFPGKSGRLPSQQDLRYVYRARNFDGK